MTGPITLLTKPQPRGIHRRPRMLLTSALTLWMTILAPIVPAAFAADPVTVVITDSLDPKDVTVEPGTTLTWRNDDGERHRIRSQSGPVEFDSGNLDPGQAFSMSFDVEGTYSYLDDRDDENTAYFGTIEVSAEATPPPGGGGEPSGDVTVDLIDDTFRPRDITIDAGTRVVWRNIDDRSHTVTARDGSFDSGIYDVGTFTRTFDVPGVYNYFCILHSGMVGSVTVNGGGGTPPPPPPPDPGPDPTPPLNVSGDVTIFDNGYTPASVDIPVGTTLTFANSGSLPHTVTDRAGRFDSGLMMSGDTYSRTFNTAGTYAYFCTIHPEMTATLTVTGADGTAPPPEAPVDGPHPAVSVKVGPSDIRVVDNDYRPRTIEVGVGSTLTWVNTGALPHTVTDRAGSFDSGLMMTGDSYRRTFSTAGTFDYYCTIHPEMVATVKVTEGASKVGSGDPSQDGIAAAGDADGTTSADITATGSRDLGAQADVEVIDLDYDPRELTVAAGTTVVWTNVGDLPHTVTAEGLFDSGLMMSGDRFTWTFDNPGTYDYLCTLHPGMVGTVIVEDGAGAVASSGSGVEGSGATTTAVEAAPTNRMSSFFTFVLVASLTLTVLVMAVAVARAARGLRGDPTS